MADQNIGIQFTVEGDKGLKVLEQFMKAFDSFAKGFATANKEMEQTSRVANATGNALDRLAKYYLSVNKAREAGAGQSAKYQRALDEIVKSTEKNSTEFNRMVRLLNMVEAAIRRVAQSSAYKSKADQQALTDLNRLKIVQGLYNGELLKSGQSLEDIIRKKVNFISSTKNEERALREQNALRLQNLGISDKTLQSATLLSDKQMQYFNVLRSGVNVEKFAIDQKKSLEAQAKKTAQGMEQGAKSTNIYERAMERLTKAFKTVLSYGTAVTLIYKVTEALKSGVQEIHDYDQALKNLQAISNATNDEVERMSVVIKKVASDTKFSTTEVAEGMVVLAQAGFTATENIRAIQHIADLSTGTLSSMKDSVDLVSTALRAFELDATETQRVVDVFANAINKSKLTMDKLRISMNYIAPIASRAGLSLEDTAAGMMELANTGLRASTIGTSFRQVLNKLVNPTKDMREELTAMGADLNRLNPLTSDFRDVVDELSKTVTSADVAFRLFGLRAAPAAIALAKEGAAGFDLMRAYTERAGSAAQMAAIQQQGLGISLKNLKDKLALVAVGIGESGLTRAFKVFYDIARGIVDIIIYLVDSPLGKLIVAIGLLTASVVALNAAMAVSNFIGFTAMVKTAWGAIVTFGQVVTWAVTGLISLKTTGLLVMSVFRGLWAVVSKHPFLLLITAVSLTVSYLNDLTHSYKELVKAKSDLRDKTDIEVRSLENQAKAAKSLKTIIDSSVATDFQKTEAVKDLYKMIGFLPPIVDKATGKFADYENVLKTAATAAEQFSHEKFVESETKKQESLAKTAELLTQMEEAYRDAEKSAQYDERMFSGTFGSILKWIAPVNYWIRITTDELKDFRQEIDNTHAEQRKNIRATMDLNQKEYAQLLKNLGVDREVINQRVHNWSGMNRDLYQFMLERLNISEEERQKNLTLWDQEAASYKQYQERRLIDHRATQNALRETQKSNLEVMKKDFEDAQAENVNAFKDSMGGYTSAHADMTDTIVKDMEGYLAILDSQLKDQGESFWEAYSDAVSDKSRTTVQDLIQHLKDYVEVIKKQLEEAKGAWLSYYDKVKEVDKEISDFYSSYRDRVRDSQRDTLTDLQKHQDSVKELGVRYKSLEQTVSAYKDAYQKVMDLKKSGTNEEDVEYQVALRTLALSEQEVKTAYSRYQAIINELRAVKEKNTVLQEDTKAMEKQNQLIQESKNRIEDLTARRQVMIDQSTNYSNKQRADNYLAIQAEERKLARLEEQAKTAKTKAVTTKDEVITEAQAARERIDAENKAAGIVADMFRMKKEMAVYDRDTAEQNYQRLQTQLDAVKNSAERINEVWKGLGETMNEAFKNQDDIDRIKSSMKEILDSVESIKDKANESYQQMASDFSAKPVEVAFTVNTEAVKKMLNEEVQKLANGEPVDLGKILKLRAYMDESSVAQTVEETSNQVRQRAAALSPVRFTSGLYTPEGEKLTDSVEGQIGQIQRTANATPVKIPTILQESTNSQELLTAMQSRLQGIVDGTTTWGKHLEPVDKIATHILGTLEETEKPRTTAHDVHSNADAVLRLLNSMDGKITKSVHIIQVQKQGADLEGYSEGGQLPGYGGGDTIHAMVEPGEFMVRKEAVRKYGSQVLHALNNMTLNIPKSSPMLKFAKGGMVPSTRETYNVNFRLDDMEFPVVMQGGDSKLAFKEFMRQVEKKRLVSTSRS